jgi:hypothetical protein
VKLVLQLREEGSFRIHAFLNWLLRTIADLRERTKEQNGRNILMKSVTIYWSHQIILLCLR